MSASLSEWDKHDRRALWRIEDGSRLIKDGITMLAMRPDWITKAETELDEAIHCLDRYLKALREAQHAYKSKPVE